MLKAEANISQSRARRPSVMDGQSFNLALNHPVIGFGRRVGAKRQPISLSTDPSVIWPPNGKTVPVAISGAGVDAVSSLAEVSYVMMDEYGLPLGILPRLLNGGSATWADQLAVEISGNGYDLDGRAYQAVATLADVAGNTATAKAIIRVPHDQR